MMYRPVKLWIVTVVCALALLVPAFAWAAGPQDSSAAPLGLWQSLSRVWLDWTQGWGAPAEGADASEVRRIEAAGGAKIDITGVSTPATPEEETLVTVGSEEPEGDGGAKIDITG